VGWEAAPPVGLRSHENCAGCVLSLTCDGVVVVGDLTGVASRNGLVLQILVSKGCLQYPYPMDIPD
jgi:hypothetical protein